MKIDPTDGVRLCRFAVEDPRFTNFHIVAAEYIAAESGGGPRCGVDVDMRKVGDDNPRRSYATTLLKNDPACIRPCNNKDGGWSVDPFTSYVDGALILGLEFDRAAAAVDLANNALRAAEWAAEDLEVTLVANSAERYCRLAGCPPEATIVVAYREKVGPEDRRTFGHVFLGEGGFLGAKKLRR